MDAKPFSPLNPPGSQTQANPRRSTNHTATVQGDRATCSWSQSWAWGWDYIPDLWCRAGTGEGENVQASQGSG